MTGILAERPCLATSRQPSRVPHFTLCCVVLDCVVLSCGVVCCIVFKGAFQDPRIKELPVSKCFITGASETAVADKRITRKNKRKVTMVL